jgi:hypothetical protein
MSEFTLPQILKRKEELLSLYESRRKFLTETEIDLKAINKMIKEMEEAEKKLTIVGEEF